MNGARLQHLGLAVADLDAAIRMHSDLFGWTLVSGPHDDQVQQARVASVGPPDGAGPLLELVAPLNEESHITRLLARGMAAYHVCCEVDDIDATLQVLRSRGCVVVREPAAAVAFSGRRIAWLYTPLRQLTELVERGC